MDYLSRTQTSGKTATILLPLRWRWSFELARILRTEYGLSPVHLFVSGRRAPQVPDPDPSIHTLPEREFLNELRRYNGTPESVLENAELMQLFLPTLRADFAVLETYVYTPEPLLDCPI